MIEKEKEKEKEKVFNDFVNERWTDQLATFEEKKERALNNAMDEAFDCAWDHQEKKMNQMHNDLNKKNIKLKRFIFDNCVQKHSDSTKSELSERAREILNLK